MRGGLCAALLCVAVVGASAPSAGASRPSALVVFVAPSTQQAGSAGDAVEYELASIPTLSSAIVSATQGAYTTTQLLLDITQGARVSSSAYSPARPPTLLLTESAGDGTGGQIEPWLAIRRRAEGAPQLLEPGLLAAQIPGGGAYAGAASVDAALAADRDGHVAATSLGPPTTLLARIAELQSDHRLVVVELPAGAAGYADLRRLAATRPPEELLIAVQGAPDAPGEELLWGAVAGVGRGGQTLTSQTTNQRGLIAAIDIAPTILGYLGLPIPAEMRGRPIRAEGTLDSGSLRALKSRLGAIGSRRLPALAWLVAAWAVLLAAVCLPVPFRVPFEAAGRRARGRSAHGVRERGAHAAATFQAAGPRVRAAWAMRVGALAILWAPVAALVPAALEPSRAIEFAMLVTVCFALGALTDRLVTWPRAPIVPAVAAVLALSVDALAGTQLLMRSLLGPNPAFGARFYGIGNELKSGLAVLVFAAVAAALYPAARSRRAAATMACAGIVLALVEGSARIGAGVGGVILVSAGTAVATAILLPGSLNRRRVLLAMAAPVLGLIALAALDLATAHGSGHFTGSVLDARSAGDIRDIVVRRYGAAWDELRNHLMPVATGLALLLSALAVRRRERVCAPVQSDPAWVAALAGGLTAGAVGALTEDSGPVLLVVAVFVLGCVLGYLWGKPLTRRSPRTRRATRSRARRRSAAPSG